jgi:hypothetical protein
VQHRPLLPTLPGVRRYLRWMKSTGRPGNLPTMARQIQIGKSRIVRDVIGHLLVAGKIIRVSRGVYGPPPPPLKLFELQSQPQAG